KRPRRVGRTFAQAFYGQAPSENEMWGGAALRIDRARIKAILEVIMTRVLVTLIASLTLAAAALPTVASAKSRHGASHAYSTQHRGSGYRAYGYSRGFLVAPRFSGRGLPHSPGTPENRGGGVDRW